MSMTASRTTGTTARSRPQTAFRKRRGLATGWLLIWSPIFLLAILLAVEVGNVFLAKVQLINALEASALAAVKQWRDTGSTAEARDYAVSYAFANKVSGEPVVLDRNDGGPPPNGNLDCAGDVVLGAVTIPDGVPDTDCSKFIFDPNESPTIGGSDIRVSLSVKVETVEDTKNDAQTGHYSFSIFDFSATDPNVTISSVTFDVATAFEQGTDSGFFDLRDPPGMGVGNDRRFGVEPIFLGTGVGNTTPSLTLADNTTSPDYTINFNGNGADAFEPGSPIGSPSTDKFEFSVDTDLVGPDTGNGSNALYADKGGDLTGSTVTVAFNLNGVPIGTISGTLILIDEDTAVLNWVNERVGVGIYGVRTSRQMPVKPICARLFGMPLPQFEVCGEAAAIAVGLDGSPRLIQIDQYLCP